MTTTTQAPRVVPGSRAHSDGAGAFVPVQTRSERPASYDPADFAAPTGREVNWRYTPVARLAPLFRDADADADALTVEVTAPAGVETYELAHGQAPRGEAFTPEDLPSAIAWHRTGSAHHVRIAADAELDAPVVIDVRGLGGVAHSHLVVEALPNAKATVLLRHSGDGQLAQNVEILVRDGATLKLVTVQQWEDDALHAASHQARVEKDAYLRHIVVSFGGGVVRVNPSIELAGAGAHADLFGLSYADAGQHLESQVYLHHRGPQTKGDVLYKGALQGVGARSVWIGDVLIGPGAVGTDSYEANRNLVLTDGARADSVPNLEIETGDILGAGHASATGRFDDEQLFYLQARGIPEPEARRLVVIGFLAEIVQKIGIPSLEAELSAAIERELAEGADR
ncbi:Fe-S cluster assembly protein SufD [Microbacterium ulmi]|uniref:Fe-S cluster assembly protein SufD n=1 Tax=Microbacterium ulmi TaxID=179095 RepID=A0A7Y2Q0G1_9MICO|nr:Fe-S cluster assembly protein SufD [Microbacterium ulmi]NII70829.1 Fe-S cluster assembly protein SufD [Microbacterium ulmi]NNH02845.1 Fe-S cluster assembly protein SufD [Microbacterium ulmi]